jgi:hypothetical protein
MLKWIANKAGEMLARFLEKQSPHYEPFSITSPDTLKYCLKPGDVLLVEGNQRISIAIKYLTMSTWSHSALYVGDALGTPNDGSELNCLIEALPTEGIIAAPLSKYARFNTRICRPVGLSGNDCQKIIDFAVGRLGHQYDLKNFVDLARYLLPTPPVPVRWRRRMLALGSGDPTRALCSTLIAQAFQAISYPILPLITTERVKNIDKVGYIEREILHIRHYSLYTPRDFDVSPYFEVVKPTIEQGFDYHNLVWSKSKR